MGKGSWWGHGRERAFSWVWLSHRRGSSGLRDKNLATPVEIWTATTGRSMAFQQSLPSKAAEALASASVFGVGVTGGPVACSCHPHWWFPGRRCARLAQAKPFFPEGGTRRGGLVQMLSFPNAPTGPELGEFQQVWGAPSCQMLAELLNC